MDVAKGMAGRHGRSPALQSDLSSLDPVHQGRLESRRTLVILTLLSLIPKARPCGGLRRARQRPWSGHGTAAKAKG